MNPSDTENYPQENYFPENYFPENYPQENYPQENYPQENYPQENYPQENYFPENINESPPFLRRYPRWSLPGANKHLSAVAASQKSVLDLRRRCRAPRGRRSCRPHR